MKNKILLVSRVLLGIVFVFSGFVKAVDPLGFNYKIEDYLIAFGWDMFLPLTFIMAVGLSCLEFVIGANLLLGANVKITAPFALLFMIFMTPLTLYLAINNPVTDCGCFGDALVISNWQTFYKNVILAAVAICVFVLRKEGRQVIKNRTQWLLTAFSGVFIVLFSLHCYYNLPIFDFRPYKVGHNIVEGMTVPHNAPQDVYKTIFVYEKNGKKKEFTLENFPDGDSSWTFVKQQSTLIEKGYEPPIHDFTIETEDDGDITSEVLRNKGYTFLLISSKLSEANLSNQDKINRIYQFAQNNGYGFYCIHLSRHGGRLSRRGRARPGSHGAGLWCRTGVRFQPAGPAHDQGRAGGTDRGGRTALAPPLAGIVRGDGQRAAAEARLRAPAPGGRSAGGPGAGARFLRGGESGGGEGPCPPLA